MAKTKFTITPNNNATASGVIPTYDGTYNYDDPNLYYDQMYPANIEHAGAAKPKLVVKMSY